MQKLIAILALFCVLNIASARVFLGLPGSTIFTAGGAAGAAGLQIGTYKLYEDFGLRANVETVIGNDGFALVGGIDALYSTGEDILFYTGGGLGYLGLSTTSTGTGGTLYLSSVVGVDFDAASTISLFLEISPRLAVSGAGFITLRSGFNFHIGEEPDPSIIIP